MSERRISLQFGILVLSIISAIITFSSIIFMYSSGVSEIVSSFYRAWIFFYPLLLRFGLWVIIGTILLAFITVFIKQKYFHEPRISYMTDEEKERLLDKYF